MPRQSFSHRWRGLIVGIILGLLASGLILVWRYSDAPFSQLLVGLELWTYNYRTTWRAARLNATHEDPIVIVAIDQASVRTLAKQWPWPREVHAQLVRRLKSEGAAVIAFDVNFDTVTPAPGQKPDPNDIFWEPKPCAGDLALARAIKEAGNVVLSVLIANRTVDNMGQREVVPEGTFPAHIFRDGAAAVADVDVPIDADSTVRRAWLSREFRDQEYPTLPVAVAALYRQRKTADFLREAKARYSDVAGADGTFWIDFHGPPANERTVPYYEALHGFGTPGLFRGKIVLIGATAPDLQDLYEVPVFTGGGVDLRRERMPGVEVHANAVRSLLAPEHLRMAPLWLTVLVTLLLGCLTGVATLYLRPLRALFTYVPAAAAAWIVLAFWLFAVRGLWVNLVLPLVGSLVTSYLATTVFAYFTVERDRKRIEAAWSKRVSPEVLQRILANPRLQHVEGRKLQATVLFSDLRGFTTLCHAWPPEEVVRRLNEIFTRMTRIITEHGGNIDKFIGDGIMAVFGDPIPQTDHARRAVLAAIDMLRAMQDLQAQATARGDQPIEMGVGIHTGELVAGDIGSADHLEYTAIGDTVSTASRLEGLNKEYHTNIIISGETQAHAGEDLPARLLDTTTVRGRETTLQVYEVLWAKY